MEGPARCPRCRGKMLSENDWYGDFGSCFACGYVYEPEEPDFAGIKEEERLAEGKQRKRQPYRHDTGRL